METAFQKPTELRDLGESTDGKTVQHHSVTAESLEKLNIQGTFEIDGIMNIIGKMHNPLGALSTHV